MSQAYAFEGQAGATGYHTHQHFTGTRLRYWPDCGLEVSTKLFKYHCTHLHGLLAFLHCKEENWGLSVYHTFSAICCQASARRSESTCMAAIYRVQRDE